MPTGQALIERALRLLEALGTAEPVSAQLQSNALAALNAMLDSWNLQRGMVLSEVETEFTLTASLNPHTIGPTGNLAVTPRPVSISHALIRDGTTDYPLEIVTLDRYLRNSDKTVEGIPCELYYDAQFDANQRGRVYLYPEPSTTYKLVCWLRSFLTTAVAWGGTPVVFAPGYEDAVVYNFAVNFAPELSREASPTVQRKAYNLLRPIKAVNSPGHVAEADPMFLHGGSGYDIKTNR